ncbi:MAG TPA: hypothetical protein VFS87_09215 [Qipengyuania sp.]|nr:hypothetical protein [Qipengyuania sp.]
MRLSEFLRRILPFYAAIAAFPLGLGAIKAFSAGAGFLLLILGAPIVLLILLVGAATWLVRAVRLARETPDRVSAALAVLASPLLLAVVLLAAWPLLVAGNRTGTLARLALNHDHYSEIIAKAQRRPVPAWFAEDGGVTYIADLGPPVRVAFNPEGFLDNWSGIIFDPTGRVMEADGFDPITGKFAAAESITKLFGGDLVSCRHLWGDYYSCSFT